jgi:hypothetical protein
MLSRQLPTPQSKATLPFFLRWHFAQFDAKASLALAALPNLPHRRVGRALGRIPELVRCHCCAQNA